LEILGLGVEISEDCSSFKCVKNGILINSLLNLVLEMLEIMLVSVRDKGVDP